MKIKIFGAGSAFKDFVSLKNESIDIVACFSSNPNSSNILNVPVISDINEFVLIPSDYVILALRDVSSAKKILIKAGISSEKILTFYNSGDSELLSEVQNDTIILNRLFDLKLRLPAISNMWMHPASELNFDNFDSVRNQTFELMATQINEKKLLGACAELGVYKGDQASIISKLFPNKPIYLFDTFEGFSQIDIDKELGKFSESSTDDFSDTSLDIVLTKLLNPKRCIIRKGYFPATAKDLEENFCFVSLDVDLYAPTLAGLKYFYPRLEPGGAIFIHDYNNKRYGGVKQAVDQYICEHNCPAIQIPDSAGSIVLLK